MKPVEEKILGRWLEAHPHWCVVGGEMTATYKFKNFTQAFDFIKLVAAVAEEQNHHPQIVNMYNVVTLSLTTHDAGNAITQRDLDFAEALEVRDDGDE
ncbi:MAG: 4a-hydroxytetrahydrobiopterin dehydratase [Alphaproteobacteria bacterium]|nr:4a-hydroxytetrahydrobiopterin dehydratase [Alphaproteobacteria bacterium]